MVFILLIPKISNEKLFTIVKIDYITVRNGGSEVVTFELKLQREELFILVYDIFHHCVCKEKQGDSGTREFRVLETKTRYSRYIYLADLYNVLPTAS